MAPKKKGAAVAAPSTSKLPSQASVGGAGGVGGMDGAGEVSQLPRRDGDPSHHTGDGRDSQLQLET